MMLKDKVFLITGASKGIGKATAMLFANNGAQVIINGRNEEELEKCKNEIERVTGKTVYSLNYDARDYNAIKDSFKWIKKNFGKLDGLVNNAGILDDALLGMINEKQVNDTFAININAVIYHMQYASRLMMKEKSGTIVNLSSIIGVTGNSGQTVYGASKAAVIGATKSAAKELAPLGIRVNAVAPGFIDTDMTKQLPPDKYQERINEIGMKKIGKPQDIANTILYLSSDLSTYVTGQIIGVDGGMVI